MWRWSLIIMVALLVLPIVYLLLIGHIPLNGDWRTANRSSVHEAPDPLTHPEAILEVYAARAFSWRGLFSVHTWIAIKPKNAKQYIVYEVLGWRKFQGLPVIMAETSVPDRRWFGNKPEIILDIRGEKAEVLIPQIQAAVATYPYPHRYWIWPGPNSNTFTAYIARQVPSMGLNLPSNALGKDYLQGWKFWARTPSGTGYQISLFGIFGVSVSRAEGLELNILGLVVGINPGEKAIYLPGVGRVLW